jgi:hypothetical protein
MRKLLIIFGVSVLLFAIGAPASANIVNGGFETGTFTGWTVSGQANVVGNGTDPRTNGNISTLAPIGGGNTYSARVGNEISWQVAGSMTSTISQTWTKDNTFASLNFAWAAVGLVPTNGGHSLTDTPWFQINIQDLTTSATLFDQEYYTGNPGSITPGWLQGVTDSGGSTGNSSGIWYYRPWQTFALNLTGINTGDQLQLILTARDCTLGGHPSYVYLDGIGSAPVVVTTPIPGAFMLLGSGLAGLVVLRMRYLRK